MIKNFCGIILMLTTALVNFNVYASGKDDKELENDYYSNYFEDEGRLLLKLRLFGVKADFKQKNLPQAISTNATPVGPLAKNGFGGDTATTIFFNDNIAAELSLGFAFIRTKNAALNNVNSNYAGTASTIKKRNIYMIPLTVTGQYHIAPFGAVRPYVGVGYNGTYLFTKAKEFRINNAYGFVFQVGADFVAKDDTFINFDLKQYLMKTKVSYKGAVVNGASGISSKIKINPLIFSLGFGFKF